MNAPMDERLQGMIGGEQHPSIYPDAPRLVAGAGLRRFGSGGQWRVELERDHDEVYEAGSTKAAVYVSGGGPPVTTTPPPTTTNPPPSTTTFPPTTTTTTTPPPVTTTSGPPSTTTTPPP